MNIHTPSSHVAVHTPIQAAITAAVITGAVIDTLGFTHALIIANNKPSGAATTSTVKLQDGAAANQSDAADVTSGAFATITTGDADVGKPLLMNVDLRKRKRYLTLVQTGVGGSAAGTINVTVILFNPAQYPVNLTQAPDAATAIKTL